MKKYLTKDIAGIPVFVLIIVVILLILFGIATSPWAALAASGILGALWIYMHLPG